MSTISPFHTTFENDYGLHIIRFVEPPDWIIQEFAGPTHGFSDPGEAIREFKKYECHQRSSYLTNTAFERRTRRRAQDIRKLAAFTGTQVFEVQR